MGAPSGAGSGRQVVVRVLPDEEAQRTPCEAAAGSAHWPRWVWSAYDAFRLADEARAAFRSISPEVSSATFCDSLFTDQKHAAGHGIR